MTEPLIAKFRVASAFLAVSLGACGGGGGGDVIDPPLATTISANSNVAATGVAGAPLTELPSVIVRDQRGGAMGGVPVTFTVTGGGGSATGTSVTTSAAGIATVGGWTLGGTVGPNSLTATTGGLPAVTFSATGTAGAPASMTKSAGDNQTAGAGAAVPVAPAVTVRDANGNPVAGAAVAFAVGSGGGTVTGGNATSNSAGVATVGSWTLGGLGTNTLIATVGGITATFTATAQDPCTLSTAHTFGTTTGGQLSTSDCQQSTGEYIDFFSVTLGSANAYLFTQTSTVLDAYLYLLAPDGSTLGEGDDTPSGTNAAIKALLPAGSYLLGASSFLENTTGAYSVASATTSSGVTNCEDVFVMRGVSTAQQLQTTDCSFLYPGHYDDEYVIYLKAGQAVTISMNSTAIDSYLELYSVSGTLVASNDDRATDTNDAQIVYTPTVAGYFVISARSFVAGQTGSYTLIIQ